MANSEKACQYCLGASVAKSIRLLGFSSASTFNASFEVKEKVGKFQLD